MVMLQDNTNSLNVGDLGDGHDELLTGGDLESPESDGYTRHCCVEIGSEWVDERVVGVR
jgi:hypothetical protein